MEFLENTEVYVLQFEIANQAKDDWLNVGWILIQYGNIDSGINLN